MCHPQSKKVQPLKGYEVQKVKRMLLMLMYGMCMDDVSGNVWVLMLGKAGEACCHRFSDPSLHLEDL